MTGAAFHGVGCIIKSIGSSDLWIMKSRSSCESVEGTGGSVQSEVATAAAQTPPRLSVPRKLAYGMGHVFNDLCASMWFTYLVLFYHKVVLLGNVYAGMLILIGQVADALATPVISFLHDKTHVRYGRRKLWHLLEHAWWQFHPSSGTHAWAARVLHWRWRWCISIIICELGWISSDRPSLILSSQS